jgi:hypothetical protein
MWLPSALRRVSGGMVFDSLAGDTLGHESLLVCLGPDPRTTISLAV